MSKHLPREVIADNAIVHQQILQPVVVDRTFELPRALYLAAGALYFGFIAVMAVGLSTPGLIVPLAICTILMGMYFAVPALWTRMAPPNPAAGLEWRRFSQDGIATLTGRLHPRDAVMQMLILPVLIFIWAIICVTIAALV